MFNFLAANTPPEDWPSSLRLLISAGARLDAQTSHAFHDRFGLKIHSFYGASETGGIAYDASDALMPEGHVGTAMPGVTILVRPEDEAAEGSGRIFVRSDSVAAGYTEDEEESSFIDGGFLTGDLGCLDGRGHLTLTGRASPAVNVAGRKVHPAEVERVLRTMNGVDDVCVIAAPDPRRGQQILACIISTPPLERARGAPVLRGASCAAQSPARDHFSALTASHTTRKDRSRTVVDTGVGAR